ncbi:MurT ligase domain-containing protein [Pseudonocardia acaciae]|uniref:MurT ligase domain-containing protein n=1 Tax=Pseudonocardia acaciae TaxID=551276 RepID=UPI00048ADF23|nr:MurT ligase domain-containing protein [Pseudonocardia acaciae]
MRAGLAVAKLSRWAGRGSGSIIGGRVTLAMQPDALRRLSAGRRVVLVSGTNGKTTTSHMVAAALRTQGAVAHNSSGSNMADGAVAALAEDRGAGRAVLEVDELHVASVARQSRPVAIVLLNLSRDQLDRASEVRKTAATIGSALAELPDTTVIANADDPMTVWAADQAAGKVVWVAAGAAWREDTLTCPRCGRVMSWSAVGWRCECGLAQPKPDWWLSEDGDDAGLTEAGTEARTDKSATPLSIGLPGQFNRANALMALAAADHERVPAGEAAEAIGRLDNVAGRYSSVTLGARTLRLLLAKNPAGWAATLSMLTPGRPLLIVVNAREADGRDTSWLWDVDFAALGERPLAASGERAADLGVRLSYADLAHHTAPDPLEALTELPEGEVDVVANYTAFYALRRRLGAAR